MALPCGEECFGGLANQFGSVTQFRDEYGSHGIPIERSSRSHRKRGGSVLQFLGKVLRIVIHVEADSDDGEGIFPGPRFHQDASYFTSAEEHIVGGLDPAIVDSEFVQGVYQCNGGEGG